MEHTPDPWTTQQLAKLDAEYPDPPWNDAKPSTEEEQMGLDISAAVRWDEEGNTLLLPDAPTAHWSYGGFHRFRTLLASEEGFDLEYMQGFYEGGGEARPWSDVNTTLAPLLNHSDCDGELTPAECTAILARLKEIRVTWAAGAARNAEDIYEYDVRHLDDLIDVVTYCAATGRNVDFH